VLPRAATCTMVPDPASQLRRAQCCNMFHGCRPRLPIWEGSGAATCPVAPDPPPYWGGLRCCHVSHSSDSTSMLGRSLTLPCVPQLRTASLLWRAPTQPRVPRLQTHLPTGEGSDAAMCPATLYGPRASSIKESHR
jgi:hypothetical protein